MLNRSMVSFRIMYTCGRCANSVVKRITAVDGLIELPTVYCGCCAKSTNLVPMSSVISEVKCETADEQTKTAGLERRTEVPEGKPVAEATEQPKGGRVDTDTSKISVEPAGKGRVGGMPKPPEKPAHKG
jgi:copper chaperone CopZ